MYCLDFSGLLLRDLTRNKLLQHGHLEYSLNQD